jgi:hypothetical protein
MESIMFLTAIVLDYKAGINHFYLLRISHAMHLLSTLKAPLFRPALASLMELFGQFADPVSIKELFTMVINGYTPSSSRVCVFQMG